MSKFFGRTRSALLAATAVAVLSLAAPSAALAAKGGVSPAVGKVLQEAQKAMTANDFATALAKSKEAQAVSGRTAADDYTINQFIAAAAVGLKDYATAAVAYEAMAESSELPEKEKQQVLGNALMLSTAQSHYAKALTYGKQLEAMGPLTGRNAVYMAQSNYQTKNFPEAQRYAKMSIEASKAAGEAPEPIAQQIVLSSQISGGDQNAARATLESLVVSTNDPNQWSNLIENSLGTKGTRDTDLLFMLRLRTATNSLKDADDYKLLANTALTLGYPVEALSVLEGGISKGHISSGSVAAQLSRARTDAAKDRASINQFAAIASKSASGDLDTKLAEAYYGYGRYADAETAARRATTKSSKDKGAAHLILGIALAMQGKDAEAQTALAASGTASAGQKRAAELWTLYTKRNRGAASAQ